MQNNEQAEYTPRLLEMRRRLTREVQMTEDALQQSVANPGELSKVPTHPADAAAEGIDGEIAIAQNEEQLLELVENALERIESGTFGSCEDCGCEIGKERLDAIPYTPWCVEHARIHDAEAESEPPQSRAL